MKKKGKNNGPLFGEKKTLKKDPSDEKGRNREGGEKPGKKKLKKTALMRDGQRRKRIPQSFTPSRIGKGTKRKGERAS